MNARSRRLDEALNAIHATREPGRIYSCGEIAAECGCHVHAIERVESIALKKLRLRLQQAGVDGRELND